ncbi:hypothetical protein GC177_07110 [bacterium]|nr:hypothetical protein [bacterium]
MNDFKIGGPGGVGKPGDLKKKRGVGSSDSAAWADALSEAEGRYGTGAPVSVNNLGFIPPVIPNLEDGTPEKKEQERGEALLQRLDRLRHMLLLGSISMGELKDIQHLVSSRRKDVMDPRLLLVMDEIDTRAKVELAKLEKLR